MTLEQILSRVTAWRAIHEDAFKAHQCADDKVDAEICAVIEKMLADYERARPLLEAVEETTWSEFQSLVRDLELYQPWMIVIMPILRAALVYREKP